MLPVGRLTLLIDWLQSDKLSRRIVSGLTLGLACMYLSWVIGYFLLPEGVLRGKTGAGIISESLSESLSVFQLALIWNMVVAFIVMPLVGLLAIGRLSLTYVLAVGNFTLYGIFLGTNSFSNPRPAPLAPNLDVFTGTGPWEIGAYMLVAAAVANRYRFRQKNWMGGGTTRISRKDERLAAGAWAAIAAAAALIIITAKIEDQRASEHASEMETAMPRDLGVVLQTLTVDATMTLS